MSRGAALGLSRRTYNGAELREPVANFLVRTKSPVDARNGSVLFVERRELRVSYNELMAMRKGGGHVRVARRRPKARTNSSWPNALAVSCPAEFGDQ
jgi:hypothetical protein